MDKKYCDPNETFKLGGSVVTCVQLSQNMRTLGKMT